MSATAAPMSLVEVDPGDAHLVHLPDCVDKGAAIAWPRYQL
jgi:hypothetical protein